VQRRYDGPYPEHLNFNTVAQMSGDAHDSSQVIGRYLWKLRTEMGREKLDPLIVKALPYIGRYRRHAETRFGRAPGYGEPGVLVDRFRNQREAFIFVAALMHASRESGETRAKQTAIAKHAGPFGMPLEVLQSIHELPLDAE